MTRSIVTARDAIATLWEATTPPSDTHRTYRQWTGREAPADATGHRAFELLVPSGGTISDFGADYSTIESTVEAVVYLSLASTRCERDVFSLVAEEAMTLINAINHNTASYGAGVGLVRATQYATAPAEDLDLELRITIEIEHEET